MTNEIGEFKIIQYGKNSFRLYEWRKINSWFGFDFGRYAWRPYYVFNFIMEGEVHLETHSLERMHEWIRDIEMSRNPKHIKVS